MKFSIIGKSNKKTDKVDAIKLAKKLKYYVMFDRSKDEFPTVTIPPKAVRELRSLFTSYQMLKKERNMTKNCIHALFKQNGLIEFRKLDLTKLHVREKIRAFKTDPVLEFQLKQMLDKLDELDKVQDAYKTMIIQIAHAEFDNQIRLLTSIKGISPFLASAIMADIMDVNRFANAKHMCSYLRAAPKIKASGDSTQVGKLNKQSRGLTMSLMAESVTHFVNSSKKMTEFYASKIKGKSAGKVRVAVIRKILATVYYMLTREVLYYYVDSKNYDNKLKQYQRVLKSKGKV
jgi:transposase